jgi:hypothetical protein
VCEYLGIASFFEEIKKRLVCNCFSESLKYDRRRKSERVLLKKLNFSKWREIFENEFPEMKRE